jgi:sugar/nucleoside kinase (ribokinase family)
MVTVDPGVRASAADVAARAPRAVAANLDQLHVVPAGASAYVTGGEDEARAYAARPPKALIGARALFLNRREALALTGEASAEDAARRLAELAEVVIVTLAAEGAIACSGGEIAAAAAKPVERPVDTTGAGDLLVAAYVWADLRGAEPAERAQWAVLYASLAVTSPTGIGGAVKEAELIEAGLEWGLTVPPVAGSVEA